MFKIVVSEDKERVKYIREGLKDNDGHCPCQASKDDTTKCICLAFREQEVEGYCHCRLYKKVLVE